MPNGRRCRLPISWRVPAPWWSRRSWSSFAWPSWRATKCRASTCWSTACRATPWARCSTSGCGSSWRPALPQRERSGSRMKIAVLGGGNGSLAAAGDFALAGHDVRLWRRDRQAIEAHRAAGGVIAIEDSRGRHEARPRLITADIGEAALRAELIVCPPPATAQPDIARVLAPHLASNQVVFVPPGTFGSMLFALAQRNAGNGADTIFAETGTLPWLARKHGPFEAAIAIRAKRLPTGVFPSRRAGHAIALLDRVFPGAIEPCGDALSGA